MPKKNEVDSEILNNMEPDEIDVHDACGSPLIEEKRWTNINTGEVFDIDGTGDVYCNECERHIGPEEIISMASYDE